MNVNLVGRSKTNEAARRPDKRLSQLSGSLVALPTPFRDGQLARDDLAQLCERQILRGSEGLVVCGSTGEMASLSAAEHAEVVAAAVAAARGRVPVIAGCTSSQEGIAAHIRAVAHAAELPVMLYDVPGRAGVGVDDLTIARLFERGAISAIKDATADFGRPPRLRRHCGEALRQFSGDDATALAHRAMGGHGCVSVTANLVPAFCAALHAAWDRGAIARAEELRDRLSPLYEALFLESNPIPLKSALGMLRLCEGELRLPLTRATATTRARLVSVIADLVSVEEDAASGRSLALVS